MEETIKVIDYLKEYNLSPRGGGGNSVRNITACPLAGICDKELFDVRKYAVALTEYLLRQETSFNLPRKLKITFSGCGRDCTGCLVNDIGFLAQCKDGKVGFKVFVGGGLGAEPRVARLLEEFLPSEDLGYCVTAIKDIFYEKGDRRNRHHNRLRFLIEDMGLEEFKKLYEDKVRELKEKEYIVLRKIAYTDKVNTKKDRAPYSAGEEVYKEFLKYNVSPQKQSGFFSIELRISCGDISSDTLIILADLEKEFNGIEFRTSQNQNIVITCVKGQDVNKLFLRLKEISEDFLYPQTLLDIVVCKGASTCNLGLCNSPALAKELERLIKKHFLGKKVFEKFDIKLNGCPNSCGQHPLGKLSFYGMVRRMDNRPVPFYKFLGGGRKEAVSTKLAEEIGVVPARSIPDFLKDLLDNLEKNLDETEDIYQFIEKCVKGISQKTLEKYSYIPSYSQDRNFYIDWGKTEEFSLAGLGPGECGAGVLDMIDADLTEAKLAMEKAKVNNFSAEDIKRAIFLSARALLVVKGEDPKSEQEAISLFKKLFVDEGLISADYRDIEDVFTHIGKDKFSYADKLLEDIKELYKDMDPSFNFPKRKEADIETAEHKILDLKGTPCPINYVKTKLFLENLRSGDILEVLLDEGEPIQNVPKSLESDGHIIVSIDKQDGFYKVVVRKK